MKKRTTYHILGLILLTLSCFLHEALYGQETQITFQKYGVEEGLPEEVANHFIQDRQGFIWVATQNGLAKFDGYSMKVFRIKRSDPNALHSRSVVGGLLEASDGRIWIGGNSDGGVLSVYDPKTEHFVNFYPDSTDKTKVPFRSNPPLFEDRDHHIWFVSSGIQNRVLCKINPITFEVSRYPIDVNAFRNEIVNNFKMAYVEEDGSIWVGGISRDLQRYDPRSDSFETIAKEGEKLPGMSVADTLYDVSPMGKSGLIPLSNNNTIYLLDPIKRQIVKELRTHIRVPRKSLGAVFEDDWENFWHSAADRLTFYDAESNMPQNYLIGKGKLDLDGIPSGINSIQPLLKTPDIIWFSLHSVNRAVSYLKYSYGDDRFAYFDTLFNDDRNEIKSSTSSKSMLLDDTGLLWMGTRPNLYKEAPKSRQFKIFEHSAKDPNSLPSDSVTYIFEDSKKRLWIGMFGAIAHYKGKGKFTKLSWYSGSQNGFDYTVISDISEDSRGQIWVRTWNALYRWNEEKQKLQRISLKINKGISSGPVEDSEGRLWLFGVDYGAIVIDPITTKVVKRFKTSDADKHGLFSSFISDIHKDSKGRMWLGDPQANKNSLFRYDEAANFFKGYHYDPNDSTTVRGDEIRYIVNDDLGRMWVGTDDGIGRYDDERDLFLWNADFNNIPSTYRYWVAGNGKLWIATYSGGGLVLIGPGINDTEIYGEEKGLLQNDVGGTGDQFMVDDFGKMWLPTVRGLAVFDTTMRTFQNYFKKDGYLDYERRVATYKTSDGNIWLGTRSGLYQVDPAELRMKDSTKGSMVITSMNIMDSVYSAPDGNLFTSAVSHSKTVTLSHEQSDIAFNFVYLHYLRSEDNLYSWKLENFDDKWSEPSTIRKANYANLDPGTYVFKVKGANADGIWNEESTVFTVVISPPWWQTIWAFLGYALLLLWIGQRVHINQRDKTIRIEREKTQERELQQAKEIAKAYKELKSTQTQLIHAEKMASLGELTAGIAHEIQNPLNFVNNFSELSAELLEEMKEEIEKGDLEEVKFIANDVKKNLEKITHHGKRADSIVKGMLQHSRTSSGVKEPTDINTLCDEYLRLAYHGLRAKDNAFNAILNTDFDSEIGKITIEAQEIGRVILNILTNAFHAVLDRQGKDGEKFKPKITVKTQKTADYVLITIVDNGNGIPESIKTKIFQPFFTTKAAGQGTGLGLSLSYDIITSHGGELRMESTSGEGSTFTIQLPL